MGNSRRPTPALFVALIALVVALAGTATALPGKNTVDKNDIKKNAVKSKAIKNGQVKAADLAANSVDGSKIVDGSVAAADLTDPEAVHLVGGAGEPAFGNGGDGDCQWSNGVLLPGANLEPAGFHKDPSGYVHLQGLPLAEDALGGDTICDTGVDFSDNVMFTLPAGYQPDNIQIFPSANTSIALLLVIPSEGATIGAQALAPGAVVAASIADGNATNLDGLTFRAPGAATAASRDGKPVDLKPILESLGVE